MHSAIYNVLWINSVIILHVHGFRGKVQSLHVWVDHTTSRHSHFIQGTREAVTSYLDLSSPAIHWAWKGPEQCLGKQKWHLLHSKFCLSWSDATTLFEHPLKMALQSHLVKSPWGHDSCFFHHEVELWSRLLQKFIRTVKFSDAAVLEKLWKGRTREYFFIILLLLFYNYGVAFYLTITLSESMMVFRRWAITITVQSEKLSWMAFWMIPSVLNSIAQKDS